MALFEDRHSQVESATTESLRTILAKGVLKDQLVTRFLTRQSPNFVSNLPGVWSQEDVWHFFVANRNVSGEIKAADLPARTVVVPREVSSNCATTSAWQVRLGRFSWGRLECCDGGPSFSLRTRTRLVNCLRRCWVNSMLLLLSIDSMTMLP